MTDKEFIEEVNKLGIELDNNQLLQLEKYYNLLVEWNEKINLTAITLKKDVYLKHFYDSLTIQKVIDLNSIDSLCDIGTGAGFPGMVLKICFPNLNVTLVDSLNKRIIFLKDVIEKLDLKQISVYHSRVEEFAFRETYDIVTARAVAPLNMLLEYSIPLVKINKYFIAMKANVENEIMNIGNCIKQLDCKLIEKKEFYLPFENSIRNLVVFQKVLKTNAKFPRKYSEIKNKPL